MIAPPSVDSGGGAFFDIRYAILDMRYLILLPQRHSLRSEGKSNTRYAQIARSEYPCSSLPRPVSFLLFLFSFWQISETLEARLVFALQLTLHLRPRQKRLPQQRNISLKQAFVAIHILHFHGINEYLRVHRLTIKLAVPT